MSNYEMASLYKEGKPIREVNSGREYTVFFNVDREDSSVSVMKKYENMMPTSNWEFL